jgi:hypothetical protein
MKKKEIDIGPLFVMIIGFLLGMVLISLTSCDKTISEQIENPIELRQKSNDRFKNVTEFTYGGCEYIKVGFGENTWGSHKGNCENPIHFENKNPR